LSSIAIICILILSIQIVYILLFLLGFAKDEKDTEQPSHPVSIIVCAHDEEQNLRELIPLLLAQDHSEFEVIIVEDRCNDGTYDFLREMAAVHKQLKMVRVVHKPDHINGKKFGLTLGIKAAKYEWLLFTDADCRPVSNQWAKRMTSQYNENTQIVLGFSPYTKKPGWLNTFIRFESVVTGIQMISLAKLGMPYMAVGRNLAYTKSLFLDHKGFNNYLAVTGGDDDLFVNGVALKKNTKVRVGSEVVTVSRPKESWREFLHQKLRHLSVGKKYKGADKIILGLFSLTWILTWFFVVPLMAFTTSLYGIGVLFIIRWILQIILIHKATGKLGMGFEVWKTPILDFIFPFYYLVTGLRALVVKRIQWKN
jgi:glycosyltransferase involved in cell wall biosynthesis